MKSGWRSDFVARTACRLDEIILTNQSDERRSAAISPSRRQPGPAWPSARAAPQVHTATCARATRAELRLTRGRGRISYLQCYRIGDTPFLPGPKAGIYLCCTRPANPWPQRPGPHCRAPTRGPPPAGGANCITMQGACRGRARSRSHQPYLPHVRATKAYMQTQRDKRGASPTSWQAVQDTLVLTLTARRCALVGRTRRLVVAVAVEGYFRRLLPLSAGGRMGRIPCNLTSILRALRRRAALAAPTLPAHAAATVRSVPPRPTYFRSRFRSRFQFRAAASRRWCCRSKQCAGRGFQSFFTCLSLMETWPGGEAESGGQQGATTMYACIKSVYLLAVSLRNTYLPSFYMEDTPLCSGSNVVTPLLFADVDRKRLLARRGPAKGRLPRQTPRPPRGSPPPPPRPEAPGGLAPGWHGQGRGQRGRPGPAGPARPARGVPATRACLRSAHERRTYQPPFGMGDTAFQGVSRREAALSITASASSPRRRARRAPCQRPQARHGHARRRRAVVCEQQGRIYIQPAMKPRISQAER